jgi:hypothetical protein
MSSAGVHFGLVSDACRSAILTITRSYHARRHRREIIARKYTKSIRGVDCDDNGREEIVTGNFSGSADQVSRLPFSVSPHESVFLYKNGLVAL